ncbi:MAG: hypothetical protein ACRETR_05130 [Steroidobacteraceae bacterium]
MLRAESTEPATGSQAAAVSGNADIRRTIAATLPSATHPRLRGARARALELIAADAQVTSAAE